MRTMLSVMLLTGYLSGLFATPNPNITIEGDTTDRHTMTFTIKGPNASETGTVNPFTDYRLIVTFQYVLSGAERYTIPGYYAADGKAGETGASSGNIWKAHFTPQWPGAHIYKVSFRTGPNIAFSTDTAAGTPVAGVDGDTGSFEFQQEGRELPPDLKAVGRLDHDKFKNYMVFVKNGFSGKRIFLKQGAASPSNFLNFADFDNTPPTAYTKNYAAHVADWKTGDPTWGSGQKGKGIIGAINYLAFKGINTLSFNTLTIVSPDNAVFPFVAANDFTRFDCSKLDQWLTVFNHANSKGIVMELRTQMAANDKLLDNGDLGNNRKLYYRELIARYAHCLGIIWNLGDENSQSFAQRTATANFIRQTDPHCYPSRPIILPLSEGTQTSGTRALFSDSSWITGISLQTNFLTVHQETKKLVDSINYNKDNAESPKVRTVTSDCQTPKSSGVPTDLFSGTPTQNDIRKYVLWGNLMAKGAGVSYYFGSTADLTCQNFRSYDRLWDYYALAEHFFRVYLLDNQLLLANQLSAMSSTDNIVTGADAWCLSLDGYQPFVVYLPNGGNANLDLSTSTTSDTLRVWWYNPRTGGALQKGAMLVGGAAVPIGNPPADAANDWVALIVPEEIGTPDDGVGVRSAKSKGLFLPRTIQTLTATDGKIRFTLGAAHRNGTVDIIASSGKVVATCSPNAAGIIEVRLKAKGVYLASVKKAGANTVVARILSM